MAKKRISGLPIVTRKRRRWAEYVIREIPIPAKWRDELAEGGLSRWAANLAIPPKPKYRVTRTFRFGKRRNAGMREYLTKEFAIEQAEEWLEDARQQWRKSRGIL